MSDEADEDERPSRAVAASEPDRLLEFPHPRETRSLFGHAGAEQELLDGWGSGRMHHAWLLTGPEGIGKATLAYRFARFVLAGGTLEGEGLAVSADHPVTRQIAARSHPNLMVLRKSWNEQRKRFGQVIAVDDIRRLRAFFGSTAARPGHRIAVIDRADDLNASSANALLKTLEEPPRKSLFLLVCSAPGRLPPTIRSRCRVLRLGPPQEPDLWRAASEALTAVGAKEPALEDRALAVRLAGGSVRGVLGILQGGGLDVYRRVIALMEDLPALDARVLHAMADKADGAAGEDGFEAVFGALLDTVLRLIRTSAGDGGASDAEARLAARLIGHRGLAPWAELWETSVRAKADALALNLDRRLLILDTFFRMQSLARETAA